MKLNRDFAVEHGSTITNYMKMGHAERVYKELEESDTLPSRIYYMAPYAVIQNKSTTTGVCMVFNTSAHRPD